jgi:hypothetical protein
MICLFVSGHNWNLSHGQGKPGTRQLAPVLESQIMGSAIGGTVAFLFSHTSNNFLAPDAAAPHVS